MELRILGAHQAETERYRFFSLMVTESLALDAGSLSSSLSWEDQAKVRSLLLTHAHFDHAKDINTLGFNHFNRGLHLDVYCLPEVRDAIKANLFSRDVWLDLSARPAPDRPTVTFHEVVPFRSFTLEGLEITPIPSIHSVPTAGYRIAEDGRSFYYTSDTGPGNAGAWARANPDLMITEVTYDSSMNETALGAGHLTPKLLRNELVNLRSATGRIPRVLVVHVNPVYQDEVARELEVVARELGASIAVAQEGMKVVV